MYMSRCACRRGKNKSFKQSMDNIKINQTKISIKHIAAAIAGLAFIVLVGQIPQSTSSAVVVPAGGIAFGPETFIRQTGMPKLVKRIFVAENFSGTFGVLVDSGMDGKNLVSSAIIRFVYDKIKT